jgi:uncharacterized membrane protein YcaP (DUF421 family)
VGELQPTELVVTILLSELVAIPIQDNSLPMATSLISAAVLIAFEILNSILAVRFNRWRTITQGHSLLVVENGEPDLKQLKNLRISLDDLMEALRQKDIFDLQDVAYCIVETTGKISVLPKSGSRSITLGDLHMKPVDKGIPFVVVYDGQAIPAHFRQTHMNAQKLEKLLREQNIAIKDVMLLTIDKIGGVNMIRKEQNTNTEKGGTL